MKKKQFMSKLAALTMAAAMGLTAVPATAVFAAETSVEASDIAATTAEQVAVVASTGSKSDPVTLKLIQTVLSGQQDDPTSQNSPKTKVNPAITGSSDADVATSILNIIGGAKLASYDSGLNAADLGDGVVENILVKGKAVSAQNTADLADKISFKITYADGQSYNVTINVDSTALTGPKKEALDEYFKNTTFTRETGVTPTSAGLAAQVKPNATDYTDLAGVTFEANGGQLTANADGTYSGSIKIKTNDADDGHIYNFTSAKFTEVSATAISDAVSKIKDNVYPNPNGAGNHSDEALNNKIAADIDAAAGEKLNASVTKTGETDASARNNWSGEYTTTIGGKTVVFGLKKSSDEKAAETNKSVETALGTATGETKYVTNHKKGTSSKVANVTKTTGTITINARNAIATALQPISSTSYASDADAAKAVEDAINAQLAKDGVADNGVTVTVKAVNTVTGDVAQTGFDGTLSNAIITEGSGDKQSDDITAGHHYTFLVTTSVANDFYGWSKTVGDTGDQTPKTEKNYLVNLSVRNQKEQKATAIDIADQTINLKNDYQSQKTNANDHTTYYLSDTTLLKLAATLTPADANNDVDWTVVDKDGNDVSDTVIYDKTSNPTYKDGKAADIKTKNNEVALLFKDAGTYTVTAKIDGVSDTATITVNSNFKDVPLTAYYAKAVTKAYALGVTSGVSDTQFGVNDDVTRAQFITWLYNYAVSQDKEVAIKDADVKQVFSDVPTTAYYAKAVQWAAENKYAAGTGDGKFSPDANVTRAQAVTFIYNVKGKPQTGAQGSTEDNTLQFTDVAQGAYYEAPVTWGVNNGVVFGLSTISFGPDKTASRAQGISFIARAFGFYN